GAPHVLERVRRGEAAGVSTPPTPQGHRFVRAGGAGLGRAGSPEYAIAVVRAAGALWRHGDGGSLGGLRNISAPGALPLPVRTLDPMNRFRRLSAVFVLAAFVPGEPAGPALHPAAHGIEHAGHAEDAAAQTEHVHAAATVFTVPLDGVPLGHDLCLLCPPQHKDAPSAPPGSAVYAA